MFLSLSSISYPQHFVGGLVETPGPEMSYLVGIEDDDDAAESVAVQNEDSTGSIDS
jgi:hypothetical protein